MPYEPTYNMHLLKLYTNNKNVHGNHFKKTHIPSYIASKGVTILNMVTTGVWEGEAFFSLIIHVITCVLWTSRLSYNTNYVMYSPKKKNPHGTSTIKYTNNCE